MELAASEKHRLEELQRAARKERETNKTEHEPKYFTQVVDPDSGDKYYAYGGARDYWKDRMNQDWAHLDKIY
jgi:hypothetical protein